MWYSTISRNVLFLRLPTPWRSEILLNTNSVIRDLFIDSDAIYRGVGGAGGDDSGLLLPAPIGWRKESGATRRRSMESVVRNDPGLPGRG